MSSIVGFRDGDDVVSKKLDTSVNSLVRLHKAGELMVIDGARFSAHEVGCVYWGQDLPDSMLAEDEVVTVYYRVDRRGSVELCADDFSYAGGYS